jgi:hypothetical protein
MTSKKKKNNKKDFDINRTSIKLIHADGFFPKGEAEALCSVVQGVNYVKKEYGMEMEHFNLILPDIHLVFSKILGEEVTIDRKRSGIVRKPFNNMIHFESFESPNEWCFILALERTTLNIYKHIADIRYNELDQVDSRNVLEGFKFDYTNLFEWDIVSNIVLDCNQGVFIRPWVFHSLQDGTVQYYRIMPKNMETIDEVKSDQTNIDSL